MLEALTKDQEKTLDVVAAEYIGIIKKKHPIKMPDVAEAVKKIYGFYYKAPPPIEVCDSLAAALRRATELTGTRQTSADWCGVADAAWIAKYDAYHRIGVLSDDEIGDVLIMKRFMLSVWDTILLDELALVVRWPTRIETDDQGRLHCSDGPCVQWQDGERDFSWHGVWVPERLITDPTSYTGAEIRSLATEVRRALGEKIGWAAVLEKLGGATDVDSWTDPKTGLVYKLSASDDGAKWISKLSPRLQDGSQPWYVEPVHEDLRTAQAARKWQAVRGATVEECESDPVLEYEIET